MNQITLLEILRDQQKELEVLAKQHFCERSEEALIKMNSKKAQVVIGVRRSGKSVLCFNALQKTGVNYAYVNFDDERLAKIHSEELNEVLRCLYQIYGDFTHLFLDEVQNVDGCHLFVNRMLRQGIHVIITGSNAKLLSSELSTHLTGRHNNIQLLPFSFKDYCSILNVPTDGSTTKSDALLRRTFDKYLETGGFPEVVTEGEDPNAYIDTLVDNILERDIIRRFKIRYKDSFCKMANHLMNNAPCEVVFRALQKEFGLRNDHTVENYVSYLYQAYLMVQVKKFSSKSKERIRNAKCYAIDVALMNARKVAFAAENLGWRLETIVFLELKRRHGTGYDIYYLKERGFEADFVVCQHATAIEVIQVSYNIDNQKTWNRETSGLIKAAIKTKCNKLTLITAYQERSIMIDGRSIKVVPCYKWLVELE